MFSLGTALRNGFSLNRSHSLNQGRLAWWLAVPNQFGATSWRDLVQASAATLSGFTGTGWSAASNPSGTGSVKTDGSASYIQTNFTTLPNYSSGTVTFWCNPQFSPTDNTAHYLCGVNQTAGNNQFAFLKYSDNNWYVGWFTAGTAYRIGPLGATSSNLTQNAWQMYACAWGAAGVFFYRNTTLLANTSTAVVTPTNNNFGLIFGAILDAGNGAVQFASAFFNDIAIFNRALTASEVAALYQLSQQGYPGVLNQSSAVTWAKGSSGAPLGPWGWQSVEREIASGGTSWVAY